VEIIMKKAFNLKQYTKQAFYEGAQGYMKPQTRGMQNCYKCKSDEGKSPQQAWDECRDEYQEANSSDWAVKYSSSKQS
jgi:hypothetical protein